MNVWLLSTIVLPIVNAKLQSEFYAGCETQPGNSSVLAEQHRNCLIHYHALKKSNILIDKEMFEMFLKICEKYNND